MSKIGSKNNYSPSKGFIFNFFLSVCLSVCFFLCCLSHSDVCVCKCIGAWVLEMSEEALDVLELES